MFSLFSCCSVLCSVAEQQEEHDDKPVVVSSKLKAILNELCTVLQCDGCSKVVICLNFRHHLVLLSKLLHENGIKFCKITGEMTQPAREKSLNIFQNVRISSWHRSL